MVVQWFLHEFGIVFEWFWDGFRMLSGSPEETGGLTLGASGHFGSHEETLPKTSVASGICLESAENGGGRRKNTGKKDEPEKVVSNNFFWF